MNYPMATKRPDWTKVMDDGSLAENNSYVTITKGTAKLAKSALVQVMDIEYYHNYGAAYQELLDILGD